MGKVVYLERTCKSCGQLHRIDEIKVRKLQGKTIHLCEVCASSFDAEVKLFGENHLIPFYFEE